MREIFVTELVKEVLGPRNGMRETIATSPLSEYITGVLAPLIEHMRRDIDSDAEIPYGESQDYEDETDDVDIHTPPFLYPALDPKSRPPSMGLSFMINSDERPIIDVCLTWATYREVKRWTWERKPRSFLVTINPDHNQDIWIDSSSQQCTPNTAEISLHVRVSQKNKNDHNIRFVTLFIVNRISFTPDTPDDHARVEHHIFQPQIRLVCRGATRVTPVDKAVGKSDQEKELSFLYTNTPLMARGHLCSVVWKRIDPERSFDGHLDFPSCTHDPPFHWIDGDLLLGNERTKFSAPDIRTEFVPIYSIASPELGWNTEYGESPELKAETYAESWSPQALRRNLEPIIDGYSRWIDQLSNEIDNFSPPDRAIADHLIRNCQQVLNRIKRGIEILCNNDEARLAFCFANKAIDLQNIWKRRHGLEWRPFQLAFIVMTIESIINPRSTDRDLCDLLWVPTGAGKTEAYLGIAVFTMVYRRRLALNNRNSAGAGVSVITRYTLRLLTIQQFRRSLAAITACEFLRVYGLKNGVRVGWRPARCHFENNYLWGSTPFSIGLWVGADVTPNYLRHHWGGSQWIPGAIDILKGKAGEGEPAQILNCPACEAILAIPEMGLRPGNCTIHLVIRTDEQQYLSSSLRGIRESFAGISVAGDPVLVKGAEGYSILSLRLKVQYNTRSADIDGLWERLKQRLGKIELVSVRASRPGYFTRWYANQKQQRQDYDYEIFCPNPDCPLHSPWCGGAPSGSIHGTQPYIQNTGEYPDGNGHIIVQEAFRIDNTIHLSDRIPVPALTVDDQIYHRVPSMVVSTVDKFARPPFEPRASALFGKIEYHHCIWGYYRLHEHVDSEDKEHPEPAGRGKRVNYVRAPALDSPDLIMQDELHLIEGPLGSQVGLYETAVNFLCQELNKRQVKYIASTATIRRAEEQAMSIFARRLQTFPVPGLTSDDRFFVREHEPHPLDDSCAGRLYVGACAPGKGPLTPIRNIWSRLLLTAWNNRDHPRIDSFWTLTGYFNAIRELAGARALYRQDIPERLKFISGGKPRPTPDDRCQELSSRTDSSNLPAILDMMSQPKAQDALFTTSMFGTGVDILRMGLMVVNGQPKTTSAYIQSTGRVGRKTGALVVTFFRASRPRDLNHYEFFCGYHIQLHRFVEPITVYPFAPGVLERAGGPVAVFILRNMLDASAVWHLNTAASMMAHQRADIPEVDQIVQEFERRTRSQPGRKSGDAELTRVTHQLLSKLDRWHQAARQNNYSLKYVEYAMQKEPQFPVVLGDSYHQHSTHDVVYENAPQSMRDIEETTGFQT